ncbi:MAG: tol-pal system protein YbgF [Gallionellaceae bacterium]|jgi:tol-pal system protein YbgF
MGKFQHYLFVVLCVTATQASAGLFSDDEARTHIQQLEVRLDQLEKSNNKLQETNKQQTGSLLDLLAQIESLNQELRGLRGQSEELAHNLQDAKNRQKDFYVDLDTRIRHFEAAEAAAQAAAGQKSADAGAVDDATAIENSAYDVVNAQYKAANYKKVLESGKEFLKKYPGSNRLPSVYYLMGDAYFSLDDFKKSIASYQAIVSKYPNSSNVPDAWLNIAACQQQLREMGVAKKTLTLLIAKYPDSKAASKARQRLKTFK